MVSISCFYCHYNREPINFTFIKYEKFVKVCLNYRIITFSNEEFVSNTKLFEIFKLSLLCTKDSSKIDKVSVPLSNGFEIMIYGIYTQRYWKYLRFTEDYHFIEFEKSNWRSPRNPLNTKEPKRASSNKKIKKFMKLFADYSCKIKDTNQLIREYLAINKFNDLIEYFTRYISYNYKVINLTLILHNYGQDVYNYVRNYL